MPWSGWGRNGGIVCKRTSSQRDDEQACPEAKKYKQPGPPMLVVAPPGADLQQVDCGATVDTVFYLANGGESDLYVAGVQLANTAMNAFTFVGMVPNGATVSRNGAALPVTVRCHSRLADQATAQLVVMTNDPRDAAAQGRRTLALAALFAYPPPTVKFLLRDGSDTRFVRVGLWDDAWNPQTGALYNDGADATNFISRDSRCFTLEVTDMEAAERNVPTVQIDWWTMRGVGNAAVDDDHPNPCSLTLTRDAGTDHYRSKPLMLVTDDADAGQATHDGINGVVQRGAAGHRLRRMRVEAADRLDHAVQARYADAIGNIVDKRADVFNRIPDERRSIRVAFVNVADAAGHVLTTPAELIAYEAVLRTAYARAGVVVDLHNSQLAAPAGCNNWANRRYLGEDPSVAAALYEPVTGHIVPHPTQTALIAQLPQRDPGTIYVFFVANIYEQFTEDAAGGEAFYAAQATLSLAQATHSMQALNAQLHAGQRAAWLWAQSQVYANRAANNWLLTVMEDAQAAGTAANGNMHVNAAAFQASLAAAQAATPRQTTLLAQLLALAQNPVLQPQQMVDAALAAQGCAFVVQQSGLRNDEAPAHEVTHILTDLHNAADGHYDLGAPNAVAPGHIDGKNLMHRFPLDSGVPQGIDRPRRLWNTAVTNQQWLVGQAPLQLPAQIDAIRAHQRFVRAY